MRSVLPAHLAESAIHHQRVLVPYNVQRPASMATSAGLTAGEPAVVW
jgi:hypothetical protein